MTVDVLACPLCGSSRHAPFEQHEDAGRLLRYQLCEVCGLVTQSPRMSDEELAEFYIAAYREAVQGAAGPTEKDLRVQAGRARALRAFSAPVLRRVGRHLDIGCSAGGLLREFARAYSCESVGVEPGAAYRRVCRSQGLEVVGSLEELDGSRRRSFDLVSAVHVLEHLPDPVNYLRTLRETWMTPDGHLLIEVPNLFGHRSVELAHLALYSARTLRQTLERAGFRVLKVRTHGEPRSPILRLYITALARATTNTGRPRRARYSSAGVRLRRRWALWVLETLTAKLPNWTWRELPEPENAGGPPDR
jgi:2-polyprenyl-3-methyl-5-hydroxy-6-metoxy-1,4-benzoquinol methylase